MAAAQQFSLRWNNYSQHIVTALEELRVDDELTDVTLSCEGQRVKAHKLLLSACSVFFKETFKENPCKHPIIILKGVSFADLQAVIQFMYNGQVNVTQERLPSFLQTAEILQIKGLTDSANSEKEESTTPTPAVTKKRPQTFPAQASTVVDSVRQDSDSRPPTPKRKRVIGTTTPSAQSSELIGTASVISASGNTGGGSSSHSTSNQSNPPPPPLIAHNSENSRDGLPIKYEEQELDDSHYDRNTLSEDNDNSFQDNGNDEIGVEQNSLGSSVRSSGAGERRPRYALQPSNDHTAGIVDATNETRIRQNGTTSDLIADGIETRKVYVTMNGNCSKLRSRLNSRSLSSSGSAGHQQQDDRVIKYAPLQTYSQDSRSNSSQERVDAMFIDEASESPQLTDDDDDQQSFNSNHQRRLSLNSGSGSQQKGSRGMPHLVKANNASNSHSQQQMTHRSNSNTATNGNLSILRGSANSSNIRGGTARGLAEELTVSSPADISTPSFSLTQQLLQQNVLCLISSNGTEVIKSSVGNNGGGNPTARVSAIAVQPSSGSNMGDQVQVAPYVCDVCGKRYVHHRSLNDHKKSHTGATRCPVCNKSFSKVANLRAHYSAQHGGESQLNDGGESSSNDVQQTQQLNGHVAV